MHTLINKTVNLQSKESEEQNKQFLSNHKCLEVVKVFKIFFILYFLEQDGENDPKGVVEAGEREDKEEKKVEAKQGKDKNTKQSKTLQD